jgi:hypothetical protein
VGERTVYLRSPLGARIRSPLGSFVAKVAQFLEILAVPILMLDGETYEITGELFGATQGTGTLLIANSPAFDDVVVTQTVGTWSDTSLTFDYDGTGLPSEGILYIKVTSDTGAFDVATSQAGDLVGIISIGNRVHNAGAGTGLCSTDPSGRFCSTVMNYENQLEDSGYAFTGNDFFQATPGFYLVGITSEKVVEYGFRDHLTTFSSPGYYSPLSQWCSAEGLLSYNGSSSSGSGAQFNILYDYIIPQNDAAYVCADSHGWTDGEDVYLIPKFPVSLQITNPPADGDDAVGSNITLAAYAFAQEGDISSSIEWYDDSETLLYTGETFIFNGLPEEGLFLTVRITNEAGQARRATRSIIAILPEIGLIFPEAGDESGGQRLTIYGSGFDPVSTVSVGGAPATSVVVISDEIIQCVTPAGTGSADVIVDVNGYEALLGGGFTYDAIDNISITSISPDDDSVSSSTTITGTGFTGDCVVYFGFQSAQELYLADNITVVDGTEITCDAPADLIGMGLVDVVVVDEATLAGDALLNGYTYT